jgi:hypothetical protein
MATVAPDIALNVVASVTCPVSANTAGAGAGAADGDVVVAPPHAVKAHDNATAHNRFSIKNGPEWMR